MTAPLLACLVCQKPASKKVQASVLQALSAFVGATVAEYRCKGCKKARDAREAMGL